MTKRTLCTIALGLLVCAAPNQSDIIKGSRPPEQTNFRLRKIADVPSGPNSYELHCVSTSVCWVGDYLKQWRTDDAGQHWALNYSSLADGNQISAVEYV